jgi:S-adenosylmethionine synthetase
MKIDANVHSIPSVSEAPFEVVELKGRGHPDTICDLLTEQISFDLGHYYLKTCGQVLHYNVDKALLVGGTSRPKFGGGEILEPTKLYLGDRAVTEFNGQELDLDGLIENSIRSWLGENLRFLRLGKNLNWKSEIKHGSAALNSVEARGVSNDTSVGVGYWPLSPLEKMTLEIESLLVSSEYRRTHPEIGEDIKIMSIRRGHEVEIVLASAIVDQFISSTDCYLEKKRKILRQLEADLKQRYGDRFQMSLVLNALDHVSAGIDGLYLTVTGLSCEGGDSGQVGRGNRVNGLISFLRPQTMEAWAGKNFKSHVGKIYSFAAKGLAKNLCASIPEIKEATVVLIGKIGAPVTQPPYVFSDIKIKGGDETKIREESKIALASAIKSSSIFEPSALFGKGVSGGGHGF